jgi:hypothetical protein
METSPITTPTKPKLTSTAGVALLGCSRRENSRVDLAHLYLDPSRSLAFSVSRWDPLGLAGSSTVGVRLHFGFGTEVSMKSFAAKPSGKATLKFLI